MTIPELGTFTRARPPIVVLTSNRTRDLHDALQAALPLPLDRLPAAGAGRRASCAARVPGRGRARRECRAAIVAATQSRPAKPPGVAETIDWVARPHAARRATHRRRRRRRHLGSVLKYREDVDLATDKGLDWLAGTG